MYIKYVKQEHTSFVDVVVLYTVVKAATNQTLQDKKNIWMMIQAIDRAKHTKSLSISI